ncbi:MAG: PD40 domain-containing protein [Candidatus Aminicenantes bacterium]|nr:PD40 domain-containing protein [Candidatus Aminicenantes bacterium]
MKIKNVIVVVLISLTCILPSFAQGSKSEKPDFLVLKGPYLGQKPPGKSPCVFAPGLICLESRSEFAESFSPGGNEFYYTMWQSKDRSDERIWYTKIMDGSWSEPRLAPFGHDCFEYRAFFSVDGRKLFYLSKRPLPGKNELSEYANLWMVARQKNGWNEPELIQFGSSSTYPRYFTVSGMGNIYFNMEGSPGIYKSAIHKGGYSEPEKLPDEIHSLAGVSHAFIAADESYMIVDAVGKSGIDGDFDLYIAFRNNDGSWRAPVHMGDDINSPYFEGAATVSADGKTIFFSRFTKGQSDIFWVDAGIIEELRAKKYPNI